MKKKETFQIKKYDVFYIDLGNHVQSNCPPKHFVFVFVDKISFSIDTSRPIL